MMCSYIPIISLLFLINSVSSLGRLDIENRKLAFSFEANFENVHSIKATASDPWPHIPKDDNLCLVVSERKLKVIIVMASDRRYHVHLEKCIEKGDTPVSQNTAYADLNEYALRMYIDEDVPFVMRHKANALMGELRKIFALADALHPDGPKHGYWTSKKRYSNPDVVMWVDGDATLTGMHGGHTLTVEEVVSIGCARSEYPLNYVRILAQDSGNNVNAGWYLISGGLFGAHFMNYLLELAEIYEPCGMWGQHVIQEALLVVMAGAPPAKWPLVLPCSGEKYHCFNNQTFHAFLHECNHDKECVIHKGANYTNSTNFNLLVRHSGMLNDCFSQSKWVFSANGQDCWNRAKLAIEKQGKVQDCRHHCCGYTSYSTPSCNNGGLPIPETPSNSSNTSTSLQSPYAVPSDKYWAASGAGVVLFNENDPKTQFNRIRIHTPFLWHHGHGRLAQGCDLW